MMGERTMWKSLLAAAVAMVALWVGSDARAQIAVYDGANVAQTIKEVTTAAQQLAQLQQQLQQLQATYQMLTHPSNVAGMLPQLNTSFAQNPMPQANQMGTQIAGMPGSMNGTAQAFFNQNHVYTPTGNDPLATTLTRTATALANIQGMAATNLQSIQQRLASLSAMQTALDSATDIKQVTAINGRIAIEANAVQGQQAQAANLQGLATAQIASQQQQQAEQIRQAHEEAVSYFGGTVQ